MVVATHTSALVARYDAIRDELSDREPESWEKVIHLCERVPSTVTASDIWKFGRDKPCWSNLRVQLGKRLAADLATSPDFGAAEVIASDEWSIEMVSGGLSWRANSNFRVAGAAAQKFLDNLHPGGLLSFLCRLYAIRCFAVALVRDEHVRHLAQQLEFDGAKMTGQQLTAWAEAFAKGVGRGWGYVTVNHLLTDLGLSIKPDLHLRRSAIWMGMLPAYSQNLGPADIDRLNRSVDSQIVEGLHELSIHIKPKAVDMRHATLREMDKVLMEWSFTGLGRPLV